MTRLVGILGGTFDPVHNGHLRAGLEVCEAGGFEQLRLLPCHIPPHRGTPAVDAATRLELLNLAIHGESALVVDDRELQRDGYSYTVDTLHSLRLDFPAVRLCLLLGTDSFLGLPTWERWRELTEHAHLVVMQRPEAERPMEETLHHWLQGRQAEDWAHLRREPAGLVLFQPVTQLAISATGLRQRLAAGGSGRYLMPDAVWDHIRINGLYGAGKGPAGR